MRTAAVLALRTLPILLLFTSMTGCAAVNESVHAAFQDNAPGEHVFIDSYASAMRTWLGLAALLQLGIAVVLWRLGSAVRDGRRWSTALGVVAPWPAVCCGAGALTVDPDTKVRWSGDPDGHSLAAEHFPSWYWPVTSTLSALIVACCVTATVALVAVRLSERRRKGIDIDA